jgi:outer membrane immunogenic protein
MGLTTSRAGRLAIGACALFIFVGAARADSSRPVYKAMARAAPLPLVYDWSGLYAGINGGAGFDTSNFATGGTNVRTRGALIGGSAGYNLQRGRRVLGVEGDLDWSDAGGGTPCGAFFCEAKNTWLGTLRGRAGYAFDRWLPYLTAGLAAGHVETTSTNPALARGSETKLGWAAGLGVEHAFDPNWSAKLEYLYVCLGRIDQGSSCTTSVFASNVSIKQSVIRLGINYKFQ